MESGPGLEPGLELGLGLGLGLGSGFGFGFGLGFGFRFGFAPRLAALTYCTSSEVATPHECSSPG